MGDRYKGSLAVVLGSLLGLLAVLGVSAPAAAGDVTVCGDYSSSPDTRFDVKNNLAFSGLVGFCLKFPDNAVVYLNGFLIGGRGLDTDTVGIQLGDSSFLWGPGIVKQFGTCVEGGNHVAVEGMLANNCGVGIFIGTGYKVKEVRIHDCTPSNFQGIGMVLIQGGFIESSIVRSCDYGVLTFANNKIWNLVVTNHAFIGLILAGPGNAVSRTVISHPRSIRTIGIDYTECGGLGEGCQDGSNSVSGHTAPLNIVVGSSTVVTQPHEQATTGATNCNGAPIGRTPLVGTIPADC